MENKIDSLLNNRFTTLFKEIDKADQVLKKESLKAVDLKNRIVDIYLQDSSEFDDNLEKLHTQEFDAKSQVDLSYQYQMILLPRLIELYNCMKLLNIEPEFEKKEDKLKFLQVNEDFNFDVQVTDERIEHSDEEYKKSFDSHRETYLKKLRETFEEDKKQAKQLKDAK